MLKNNLSVRTTRILMTVSGALGFTFAVIANCTELFYGLNVLAGCIQLAINAFVFTSWREGYKQSTSRFGKFVAGCGVVIPILMATITIVNVLLPALWRALLTF